MTENDKKNRLTEYYNELYPFDEICRWLCYGRPELFANREFSVTIQETIYNRYQSYKDVADFKLNILRITPDKIDIGAIYNSRPKKGDRMIAIEKELIFDIDVSDYDDGRTCCKNTQICPKCWKFIVIAVKILDSALREDFNFQHILWVYSGRRGVHCWVCDKSARQLDMKQRIAIAKYLSIQNDSPNGKIVLDKEFIHPFIRRSLDIIRPTFFSLCICEQNILDSKEKLKCFLKLIPNAKVRRDVSELCSQFATSVDKWGGLSLYLNRSKDEQLPRAHRFLEEIALGYCCLRLDIEVTKSKKHLLKAPFSVHPETGNISIPFDAGSIDSFSLEDDIPNISQLCINDTSERTAKLNNDQIKFANSLHVFNEFIGKLETANYV